MPDENSETSARDLVRLWASLRLYTILCALVATVVFKETAAEMSVSMWPPSSPLGAWLARLFLAPWNRWDVEYYVLIATEGYGRDNGTAAFHPLLAWLASPLAWAGISPVLALLLVSSVACLLAYIAFERLALVDQTAETARTSTLLFVFWPTSYILHAPYTESLWLACGVACLLFARQGRWWLAGAAGGLAALTKQQGVILALPLAWELWEASGRDWRRALALWRKWLALALVPFGLLVWMVFRQIALDDFRPDFSSFNAFIYSTIISPSSNKVVWDQGFMWPWKAAWLGLRSAWELWRLDPWMSLAFGLLFVAAAGIAWRGMRTSYKLFVLAILVITLSYHTGMNNTSGAYISLPRHLMLAFPVFIGLGARTGVRWRPFIKYAGLLGFTFLLFGYFSKWLLA
ncbi:MAG TPA: hypothetical protein VFX96_10830 [Pyrinomonadaceae bacterium]|nr:hypothetical protein [Pyrinomonadaceae bacterium]